MKKKEVIIKDTG